MERGIWLLMASLMALSGCTTNLPAERPATRTAAATPPPADTAAPAPGARFSFQPKSGTAIQVWMHTPRQVNTDTGIIIVLHGVGRDAPGTFRAWERAMSGRNLIIVAPQFSEPDYAGGRYAEGNVTDKLLAANPVNDWTFTIIEELFDHVRRQTGATAADYQLYGHSAGAQFTHRMVMMMPATARIRAAYAANAGWYLMPDEQVRYPYGLAGAPPNAVASCVAYRRRLTILLGEEDNDPNHPQLNRSRGAMAQGDNRLARGKRFFQNAQLDARQRGCPFNWSMTTVPGAAHEQAKMAAATARLVQLPSGDKLRP